MNDLEGLNLPQLLDLLHALVEPAPVPWVPQTIGWLVVTIWLVAVIAIIALRAVSRWRSNRYRRAALAELRRISADPSHPLLAQEVAALLKRTALAVFPRSDVASLYGTDWASFLARTAAHDPVVTKSADAMASAAYRPDTDGAQLLEPARRWIKVHRA